MGDTNYKKDMEIDSQALEVDWLRHSAMYMKYAEMCALAEKNKNQAKDQFEVTKAECDRDIRALKTEAGERVTETIISVAVVLHPEYQKSSTAYNLAVYEYNILSFVMKALEHRKKALENLVQLYLSGYFSGPKEPRNGDSIKDKIIESAHNNQKAGLKKKRRK